MAQQGHYHQNEVEPSMAIHPNWSQQQGNTSGAPSSAGLSQASNYPPVGNHLQTGPDERAAGASNRYPVYQHLNLQPATAATRTQATWLSVQNNVAPAVQYNNGGPLPVQDNNVSVHNSAKFEITRRTKQTELNPLGLDTKYRLGGFLRYLPAKYQFDQRELHRHQDPMGRVLERPRCDRYTKPGDSKLRNLYVQATDYVRQNAPPGSSTWRTTHIRKVGPTALTLASWPTSNVPTDTKNWSPGDWMQVIGKWALATIALGFVLPYNSSLGELRNGGDYDPVEYHYWPYMKKYRNDHENHPSRQRERRSRDPFNTSAVETTKSLARNLRPKKLCFLLEERGYTVAETSGPTEYLFIAYASRHFQSYEESQELLRIAEAATRTAGLPAFWIGLECLRGLEIEGTIFNPEIYQINDYVRLATCLVIALPDVGDDDGSWVERLSEWGDRMWTFPEALLCPNPLISIYAAGQDHSKPFTQIPKAQFPEYAWRDAYDARQLMDHFLGSIQLSRLEFAKVAVQCLLRRAKRDQEHAGALSKLLLGDMAYCYQGLLRVRPSIDSGDSEFEAFIKLSMANDSDQLFERMVSMLPKSTDHFFTNDDEWDAELWDIQPTCQVAGVDNGTVLIDGLRGANIRWKSFKRIVYTQRLGFRRLLAHYALSFNFPIFILLAAGTLFLPLVGVLLLLSICCWVATPYLVTLMHGGKVWGHQDWLFGFEGYMDIATIERMIFGNFEGRLSWSITASSLSRHQEDEYHQRIGIDPTTDQETMARVERAARSGLGEEKIFTLVDTGSLTVTMFAAQRPPTALMVTGMEGGMQRAVLCSYDWVTGTMYRETVLRIETPSLDSFSRVSRIRFGFQAPNMQPVPTPPPGAPLIQPIAAHGVPEKGFGSPYVLPHNSAHAPPFQYPPAK